MKKVSILVLALSVLFGSVYCNISAATKRLLVATGIGCGAGLAFGAAYDEYQRKKDSKDRKKVSNRMLGIFKKKKKQNKGKMVGLATGCLAGLGTGLYLNMMYEDINEKFGQDGITLQKVPGPDGETSELLVQMDGNMNFNGNAATFKGSGESNVTKVSESLLGYPDTKIKITGHTSKGSSDVAFNQKLSQERADAAKNIMVGHGVEAGRIISSEGMSFNKPVPGKSDKDAANRRVEIRIVGE